MKLNKKDFINAAFVYESDYLDGVECWESAAQGLISAYTDSLCPRPTDNIKDYITFDYEESYAEILESIIEKLRSSYNDDEDAMLEDLHSY